MHFELLPDGGASPESMDIKSFVSCHRRRRLKAQFLLAGTRRRAGAQEPYNSRGFVGKGVS